MRVGATADAFCGGKHIALVVHQGHAHRERLRRIQIVWAFYRVISAKKGAAGKNILPTVEGKGVDNATHRCVPRPCFPSLLNGDAEVCGVARTRAVYDEMGGNKVARWRPGVFSLVNVNTRDAVNRADETGLHRHIGMDAIERAAIPAAHLAVGMAGGHKWAAEQLVIWLGCGGAGHRAAAVFHFVGRTRHRAARAVGNASDLVRFLVERACHRHIAGDVHQGAACAAAAAAA